MEIKQNGWRKMKLQDIAPLQRGFDLPASNIVNGIYPVVCSNGIVGYHNEYKVEGNGVVTGRSGTIGTVQYINGNFWPHNTTLWVTNFNNNDVKFIYYILCNIDFLHYSTGSGVPTLNRNDIHLHEILLPPLPEQQAIATALSDMDGLISSLTKLIDKKKNIKQGAMQELLTGKKRLDGFSGKCVKKTEFGLIPEDWEFSNWLDVLDGFTSGATPYRAIESYYNGNIKWITSGELNYNVIYDTLEHISEEAREKTNLKVHPAGTFLMAITGLEAEGTRGSCGIVGEPATTNQSCMAIYGTEKLSIKYLFYFYIIYGNELAFKYCQGTKQQSYTAKIVKQLPIVYPTNIKEQQAIVTFISDMDSEIEILKNRLNKYKNIKQGLMEELLTGRIRLLEEVSQ